MQSKINEDQSSRNEDLSAIKIKAATLLKIKPDELDSAEINGIGIRFYEPIRGGRSLIIGNDGGLLYANSSVSSEQHEQAYRDGRRTPEETFI